MRLKVARVNISIPDQLKASMDQFPDRKNWSAVAAEAFSREVRMLARVESMNLDEIVKRLRATREEEKDMERALGHEAGANWAAHRALYSQLKLFAEARRDIAVGALLTGTADDGRLSKFELLEFWRLAIGSPKVPSRHFVEGFVEGASQVWARVAARVEQDL
jgi:hypothetical protein